MRFPINVLGLVSAVMMLFTGPSRAAETVMITNVTCYLYGLSGNNLPSCDYSGLTADFIVGPKDVIDYMPDCCGVLYNFETPTVTNDFPGSSSFQVIYRLIDDGEICDVQPPVVNIGEATNCFEVVIIPNETRIWRETWTGRPSSVSWTVILQRNTNSFPIANWEVVNQTPETKITQPSEQCHYRLPADGKSYAFATPRDPSDDVTWIFTGDSLGCTLTNGSTLIAGTNSGTVQLTAISTNAAFCAIRDFYFDLQKVEECKACAGGTICPRPQNRSVYLEFDLGPSISTTYPTHLEVESEFPTVALGNPSLLRCNFIRPDLLKLTNSAGWLRQVRSMEALVDIVTNSATSYSLKYYYVTNITGLSNDLFTVQGSPYQTFTVSLVSGNTNQVRLHESLNGTSSDFYWNTNGWTLVSPNSLRFEAKSVSVSGGYRTEATTIQNAADVVSRAMMKRWQTNSLGVGEVVEDVFGTGADARTNLFVYDINGRLRQATRWDGSWDIYVYDSRGRVTEHYQPHLNSAPTTNSSLCRVTEFTYTNSVVSGSGDDHRQSLMIPRRVIESVLGTEISRRYTVVKLGEHREILCPNPGAAWNDSANLVTTNYLRIDARYLGRPYKIARPDGTVQLFGYIRQGLPGAYEPFFEKTVTLTGAPSVGGNDIIEGTVEEAWEDNGHRTLMRRVTEVPSNLVISQERHYYDLLGRLTNTVYIDGTSMSQTYDCCGVSSRTDRDGTVTSYTYDALRRELTSTRDGITTSNVWDSSGNLLANYRIGTNGTTIRTSASLYDTAGRLLATTNALNQATLYAESVDLSTGVTTRTTTNPDGSTRIETTARDGNLLAISGTSVLPVRYTNGVASVGGVNRSFSQEIKLLTNGTDSAEWVKSVNDGLGRAIETQFPDNSTNRAIYNVQGQLASEVDPDGVVTLYSYNTLGELAYRALDVDRNGTIDLGGIDRVTATVSDVVSNATYGATVRRSSTYVWDTTNNATPTLLSENATSVDGRQRWSTFNGLTSYSRMDFLGNGATRTMQTGPDGTQTIQDFQSGRMISSVTQNSQLGILNSTTTSYDAHRRQNAVTDLRTGTTTFTFDDLDRVLTLTTPAPAAGESAQVTTSVYDEMGRVIRTQAPDSLWTTNEYYLTGLYRKTSGARVYPVEYTFDYAGRLGAMTTWQDYASSAGAAVTQWKYEGTRGFLTNKVYQGTNGPGYTYTRAGRLSTRTWARGLTTSYSYNNAGELAGADYSDATPDVAYAYDRQGRPAQITGATTNDFAFTAAGLLLSENVVNKTWNYASQTRLGYDALQRRSGLTNLSLGLTHTYAYDAASRLQSVSTLDSGAASLVSYSYVSNSPLVGGITFQQGGTTRLTTSKSYDNLNRLRQINSVTNSQSVASFAYAYNAANQRTAVTNVDGSRWSFGYDQLGQVTNGTRYWSDGSRVAGQQFGFGFDTIGNRLWATTGGDAVGSSLRLATYSVNALNQYTNRSVPGYIEVNGSADSASSVTVNGGAVTRQGEYYRQEASVNNASAAVVQWLTSRATNTTGTSIVARLSFTPQTPESYVHDADGNLTQDGLWNYSWDAENRLTRVETRTNAITDSSYWTRVDSSYDFASRRMRKQVYVWNPGASAYQMSAGLRYFYRGWNLIGQLDEVTGTRLSFVWGTDLSGSMQGAGGVEGLKEMIVHNGSLAGTYFYSYDGNGNVAALLNSTDGSEVARYEYGPFLELIRATGPLARLNPFRASTKYQDDETDLLYYGYRYLSTVTGRWFGKDSLGELGGINLYGFSLNNSIDYFDTDGRFVGAPEIGVITTTTLGTGSSGGAGVVVTVGGSAAGVGVGTIAVGVGSAAVVGGALGYGTSQLPVVGGGTVADFWGDVIYDLLPKPKIPVPQPTQRPKLKPLPDIDDPKADPRLPKDPLHRGRIQAQGCGPDESVAWAQMSPPSVSQGLSMVVELEAKLSKPQLAVFTKLGLLNEARTWIQNVGDSGGVSAPVSKTFKGRGLKHTRVDIEVRKGRAFIR